jgi:NAD(P)-dependent dehydrogenase (short-subunit alcohol dehydrogenase family)
LTGRTAIVTGAGAGIGKGIALSFASFGARVAVFERDEGTARETVRQIEAGGGEAFAVPIDVRDGDAVESAVAAACERWGDIDVLVNNVGGVFAAPFLETNERGWDALYRANLKHVFHCSKSVGRRMVDAGRGGAIINVVSIEGVRAAPLFAAYAAAKAGAINFTKSLALELAADGIRVNAIAPDYCETEGLRAQTGGDASGAAMIPMRRAGKPEDIAGAAIFLASDLSSYVTGECLHVDGGTHAAGGWYPDPATGAYTLGPSRRRG